MAAECMSTAPKNDYSPLLPDRTGQGDFFVCDIFDAAPKGDMASMEHPIFAVSTKPDKQVRRYENGRNFVEITPSVAGLATVHDRDILIFCISQIMSALAEGRKVSQIVRFQAYDMLRSTNRMTNGQAYSGLLSALTRLRGTTITTNITTGSQEVTKGFGLIESFEVVRKTRDGRMQEVEITLSDWVFNAIRHNEVLTLHRDYFRLRKPIERRIYELARKHCGAQKAWKVSLEVLLKKSGSRSSEKEFRRSIRELIETDHLPDYTVELLPDDMVIFRNRNTMPVPVTETAEIRPLDPEVYDLARNVAPGWDVRYLEQEWRAWATETPRNPEMAFVGFCRKWAERKGTP